MDIDVLGSYNTLKATIPHLTKSAAKHKVDSQSCKYSFHEQHSPRAFVLSIFSDE
jgi:hypothetical protein